MKAISLATVVGLVVGIGIVYWIGGLNNAAIALVLVLTVGLSNYVAMLLAKRGTKP